MNSLLNNSETRTLDYLLLLPHLEEEIIVKDIPLHSVWIEAEESETSDVVMIRDINTIKKFIDISLEVGILSIEDIMAKKVSVTIDRSEGPDKGNISVETLTDIYSFSSSNQELSSLSVNLPIKDSIDFLEDIEEPWTKQTRLIFEMYS